MALIRVTGKPQVSGENLNPRDIILNPVVSEKSYALSESGLILSAETGR